MNMSSINIDESVLEKIIKEIIIIERENLKTNELSDSKMVATIKKIIENEVELD